MIEINVLQRFSATEQRTCQACSNDKDRFYFHCNLENGSTRTICGSCLFAMSNDEEKFHVISLAGAEGIGEEGIYNFLKRYYLKKQFSNDWEIATAILLPHQETNQKESPSGEWIFTGILDRNGELLEDNSDDNILGIYPSREIAEEEISRYLRSRGSQNISFDFIKIDNENWKEIKAILNSKFNYFAWEIFIKSKSNEDIRKYIANVKKSIGAHGATF
jgi:hypothetical protein